MPVARPPPRSARIGRRRSPAEPRPKLEFFNGLGGFADDGREYVVVLGPGQSTPAPWLNVIANPSFGFQVSESGSAATRWSENSRENQLTAWSNDAVTDPVGEAIYVRDDETGEVWGPTALPVRVEGSTYVARHGRGYSRFEHRHDGIGLDLVQFVAARRAAEGRGPHRREPLGPSPATVGDRVRRVGPRRRPAAPRPAAHRHRARARDRSDPRTQPVEHRVRSVASPSSTWADGRRPGPRTGPSSSAATAIRTGPPASTRGHRSQGPVGAALDPCAALQTSVELADGERTQIVVLLGQAADAAGAVAAIRRGRALDHEAALRAIATPWDDDARRGPGPDARPLDGLLLNGWLLYQTLACRLWARAGFYQAGGAFGFRDQLQDVIALTTSRPGLVREHLLRAAARQFAGRATSSTGGIRRRGRGVRTRISDDRLWLPYVVDRYLAATGDDADPRRDASRSSRGRRCNAGPGRRLLPARSPPASPPSLYEHCARPSSVSLAVGRSRAAADGLGRLERRHEPGRARRPRRERLARLVPAYGPGHADARSPRRAATRRAADRWRAHAKALRRALERHGWDGDWYRRAYFDDGTPLGSALNDECRIDSIAQSWSVLSGAADPAATRQRAMAAARGIPRPARRRPGPAVHPALRPTATSIPGYIKGYLPGVRENGGQYTHGAIWAVLAFAALGDGDKAGELFSILNPINHASTRAGVHRYKVEPYVMAADVYAEPPHVGRGGWTWYTGSAGWMYQAGVESILGFRLRGATLVVDPCIPRAWPSLRDRLRLPLIALRDHRGEPAWRQSRCRRRPSWTTRRYTAGQDRGRRSRWWTTAPCTECG